MILCFLVLENNEKAEVLKLKLCGLFIWLKERDVALQRLYSEILTFNDIYKG